MWKNRLKEKLKNENGFMSIEAVMGMATILMVILLGVGFFTYMIPRQAIEAEVHMLGNKAKIQGGLTEDDVMMFKNELKERGIAEDDNDIVVTLTSEDTDGVVQTEQIDDITTNNIKRASKADEIRILELRVEVPANKAGVNGAMSFFGGENSLSDKHVFSERFMSEFYQ